MELSYRVPCYHYSSPHITGQDMRRCHLFKMRERSVCQGGDSGSLSLSSLSICFDAVESLTVTDDDLLMPFKECMERKQSHTLAEEREVILSNTALGGRYLLETLWAIWEPMLDLYFEELLDPESWVTWSPWPLASRCPVTLDPLSRNQEFTCCDIPGTLDSEGWRW